MEDFRFSLHLTWRTKNGKIATSSDRNAVVRYLFLYYSDAFTKITFLVTILTLMSFKRCMLIHQRRVSEEYPMRNIS